MFRLFRFYSNKKGFIDEAIAIIVFIFLVAGILLFFRFSENSKSNKTFNDIQLQKDILEGNQILTNYLTKSDEDGKNKADILADSYTKRDYEGVKKDIESYFKEKISKPGWQIQVRDQSREILLVSGEGSIHSIHFYQVASILIPVKSSLLLAPQYLLITLSFGDLLERTID